MWEVVAVAVMHLIREITFDTNSIIEVFEIGSRSN